MATKIKQALIDRLKGKKSEPPIANIKTRPDLIKALNSYHLDYERDDARKWIIEYCKHRNLTDILAVVKEKDFEYPASITTLGFCCRMKLRGLEMIEDSTIIDKLRQCKSRVKEVKPTVRQHRINPLGVLYVGAYDDTIDNLKPVEIKLEGSPADIADVLKQAQKDLDDITGYPEEYPKKHIKPLTAFLKNVLGQKPVRKTPVRIAKPKPPSKLVAKLRYKREHTPLGLKSINPEKIIGASELIVYNVDNRELSVFVADNRLSVNGINITDYNPDKSYAVTIRKPEEMFALSPTHRTMLSKLKTIKAVKRKPRHRLPESTILISVKT